MPTFNQLIHHGREEKRRTDRTRALDQCPQKQGVCLRVSTRTPKKPNSSIRKVAKVRLSNRHDIYAHIPDEGHNSQEHPIVLVRGGRVNDFPGVKSHCIRGVKDLLGIADRQRGMSKYSAETFLIERDRMSVFSSFYMLMAPLLLVKRLQTYCCLGLLIAFLLEEVETVSGQRNLRLRSFSSGAYNMKRE